MPDLIGRYIGMALTSLMLFSSLVQTLLYRMTAIFYRMNMLSCRMNIIHKSPCFSLENIAYICKRTGHVFFGFHVSQK